MGNAQRSQVPHLSAENGRNDRLRAVPKMCCLSQGMAPAWGTHLRTLQL